MPRWEGNEHQVPNVLRKKRKNRIIELDLPKAVEAGVRSYEYVKIIDESPWEHFQSVYELKFDAFVTVAIRKVPAFDTETVKKVKKLDMLQRIRHENFVAFLEAYQFQNCSYAILQHEDISLARIVASPPYPNELELAAILGQVRRRGVNRIPINGSRF